MKKYFTPADLFNAADEIVTKKVKAYTTDWTEYDAPKFLEMAQQLDGAAVLIAREHGTYISHIKIGRKDYQWNGAAYGAYVD